MHGHVEVIRVVSGPDPGTQIIIIGWEGPAGQRDCWRGDALDVIDVSNPAQPKLVHRYDTSNWLYGLPASADFTYVPDADETWMVYDLSNPADPQQVGGYKTIASARRGSPHATVAGAYAYVTYVTASTTALQILDIRNPANPQRVGSYDPGHWPIRSIMRRSEN